jgi:hypothetical protein
MEKAALQGSDQKRIDNLKRIRGVMECKGWLLSKSKKAHIIECKQVMGRVR